MKKQLINYLPSLENSVAQYPVYSSVSNAHDSPDNRDVVADYLDEQLALRKNSVFTPSLVLADLMKDVETLKHNFESFILKENVGPKKETKTDVFQKANLSRVWTGNARQPSRVEKTVSCRPAKSELPIGGGSDDVTTSRKTVTNQTGIST